MTGDEKTMKPTGDFSRSLERILGVSKDEVKEQERRERDEGSGRSPESKERKPR